MTQEQDHTNVQVDLAAHDLINFGAVFVDLPVRRHW